MAMTRMKTPINPPLQAHKGVEEKTSCGRENLPWIKLARIKQDTPTEQFIREAKKGDPN